MIRSRVFRVNNDRVGLCIVVDLYVVWCVLGWVFIGVLAVFLGVGACPGFVY